MLKIYLAPSMWGEGRKVQGDGNPVDKEIVSVQEEGKEEVELGFPRW